MATTQQRIIGATLGLIAHHNNEAIAGLHQTLAVVSSPTDTIEQLVRYVAAISSHGHSLQTHHDLPPELGQQLSAFDDELEHQIRLALTDGAGSGVFRSTLSIDTTARLVRHMLNGLSELVAGSPDRAPSIVSEATETVLAALANEHRP
ncbi:MAG: hypothetical protein GY929_05095 [Actinomycetia bacterium]|nr:hypothetical protein [Actinomycetes bacterium]MCP5025645.1 hypothetical protein [Actinomycetes bacterium]